MNWCLNITSISNIVFAYIMFPKSRTALVDDNAIIFILLLQTKVMKLMLIDYANKILSNIFVLN